MILCEPPLDHFPCKFESWTNVQLVRRLRTRHTPWYRAWLGQPCVLDISGQGRLEAMKLPHQKRGNSAVQGARDRRCRGSQPRWLKRMESIR